MFSLWTFEFASCRQRTTFRDHNFWYIMPEVLFFFFRECAFKAFFSPRSSFSEWEGGGLVEIWKFVTSINQVLFGVAFDWFATVVDDWQSSSNSRAIAENNLTLTKLDKSSKEIHLARIRNVIAPVPTTRICVNSFNTLPGAAKLSIHEVLVLTMLIVIIYFFCSLEDKRHVRTHTMSNIQITIFKLTYL